MSYVPARAPEPRKVDPRPRDNLSAHSTRPTTLTPSNSISIHDRGRGVEGTVSHYVPVRRGLSYGHGVRGVERTDSRYGMVGRTDLPYENGVRGVEGTDSRYATGMLGSNRENATSNMPLMRSFPESVSGVRGVSRVSENSPFIARSRNEIPLG
jgi:hypothetical protein